MDQPSSPDIVAFLKEAGKWVGDELDLEQVKVNDRVLVRTKNSVYLFIMTGPNTAQLKCDRTDRPHGAVFVKGCSFGKSRMIKPRHLFCGGNLEFMTAENSQTYTTSSIAGLEWLSRSAQPA